MLVRFTRAKRPDNPDVLTCVRQDGSSCWMHERPGFVYHDLAHYAAETAFGYAYGFFGLVRSGWDLSAADFGRDPVTKERYPWPDPSGVPVEPVEYVVSLLQREARGHMVEDETVSASLAETALDFYDAMRVYTGDTAPRLPEHQLSAARERLRQLYTQWEQVAPSGCLELTFTVAAASAVPTISGKEQ